MSERKKQIQNACDGCDGDHGLDPAHLRRLAEAASKPLCRPSSERSLSIAWIGWMHRLVSLNRLTTILAEQWNYIAKP